tara:strand:- start:229 stop:501 length:273 start_codon:yes stop_codon:yes gene_type:complete
MISETTIYILFGITAFFIIGLLLMFLMYMNKQKEAHNETADYVKRYTNNKITALDRVTPKCKIDGNGEVKLYTPDGKIEIGLVGNLPNNN